MISIALIASCLSLNADPELITAILKQESSGEIAALNINGWDGKRVIPETIEDSVVLARNFIDKGYTVDVGLMGINSVNVERLGHTIQSAYEPCMNIGLGEQILVENIENANAAGYQGDEALRVALSLYNTGSFTYGFTNGYVERVWTHYTREKNYRARRSAMEVPWDRTETWSRQANQLQHKWNSVDE